MFVDSSDGQIVSTIRKPVRQKSLKSHIWLVVFCSKLIVGYSSAMTSLLDMDLYPLCFHTPR